MRHSEQLNCDLRTNAVDSQVNKLNVDFIELPFAYTVYLCVINVYALMIVY